MQALQDVSGGLLHHEASLTLHDASGADPVPASIFMPPAVRLGLSAECDIQALRLGLDWLYAQHGRCGARGALGSLSQPGFLARLEKMLGDRRPHPAADHRRMPPACSNRTPRCASCAVWPRKPARA